MVQSEFNINDLFQRYFTAGLNDHEYKQLTELLHDKKNLEKFEAYKRQWNNAPSSNDFVLKNWNRLNYKIAGLKSNGDSVSVKKRYLNRVISYAAILIIGLLMGGLANYFIAESDTSPQEFVFETPRGEKSKVTLPDGSEVWLNAKSRLAFTNFGEQRKVHLQGEAFFEVTHDKTKPFTVVTPECNVEVLGTSFNVMAYNEFGRNEVTLVKGSVKISSENETKLLKPNQVALVKNGRLKINEVEPDKSFAWVSNKFDFYNIPLSELVKRLENWYDVDIELTGSVDSNITFTGVFKNEETIWQVLDALKVYLPISYKRIKSRRVEVWINK